MAGFVYSSSVEPLGNLTLPALLLVFPERSGAGLEPRTFSFNPPADFHVDIFFLFVLDPKDDRLSLCEFQPLDGI